MAQDNLKVTSVEQLESLLAKTKKSLDNIVESGEKAMQGLEQYSAESPSLLNLNEQVTNLWAPVVESLKELRENAIPALDRALVNAKQAQEAQKLDLGRAYQD